MSTVTQGRLLAGFFISQCIGLSLYSASTQADILDDSVTTLRYANYPWMADRVTKDEGTPTYKEGEWIHALELKFNSGYFNDFIGVDYTIYGVQTIAVKDDATLTKNINGIDDKGHGGTNELYLKLKMDFDDYEIKGGYGKKRRTFETYRDFNFRIVAGTTVGGDISISGDNFIAYASVIDKASPHNKDYFGNSLKTFSGETIDYIGIYGIKYQILSNLELHAEHLEAKDYLKRSFYSANYVHDLNEIKALDFNVRYGTMSDAGDLFERTPLGPNGQYANDPDGLDSSFNEFAITYRDSRLDYYTTLWRTDVNGDDYNRVLFTEAYGTLSNRTGALWHWFGFEGETTWGIKAGINLAKHGIPGLSLHGTFARSNSAAGFTDYYRQDIQTAVSYDAQSEMFKGLSFVYVHMEPTGSGTPDGINRHGIGSGPSALGQIKVDRLYINYIKTF